MTEYVTVWRDHEPTKLHWDVPVVRCRDCRYSSYDNCWCYRLTVAYEPPITPDGFCAWGERRDA